MLRRFRKLVWDVSSRTGPFRGKERLVALLSRPGQIGDVLIRREGVSFAIQGHDLNEFCLAVRPTHSSSIASALRREIADRKVCCFWDVGANIGAISLPLLDQHGDLQVVMFEPSAEVAGRLIRNLSHNPHLLDRARVMTIALAANQGLVDFYLSHPPANSGMGGLGESDNRLQFPIKVQAYPGDALIAAGLCPPPDLIKIDVEGFELDVLRGLARTLAARHPTIVFEHSIKRLRERGLAHDAVKRFLESMGYVVTRLDDAKPVAAADLLKNTDFIARPSLAAPEA